MMGTRPEVSMGSAASANRRERPGGAEAAFPGSVNALAGSRWSYLAVALLAFLTFSNSLGNYFLMDDFWHLSKIAHIGWNDWWKPWSFSATDNLSYWMSLSRVRGIEEGTFFFRPAVTVVYILSEKLGGGAAWGFHLSNILLHASTTMVFLALARTLLGRNLAAFGAALIFAAHPAHCEDVQWIAANADLLAGLFFALAFLGHVRARKAPGGNSWRWAALAGGSFFLALCSKEIAIVFPAVAFVYDLVFYRPGILQSANQTRISMLNPTPLWRSKYFYALLGGYAVIAGLYLAEHFSVIRDVADLNEGGNYMADWRAPGFLSTVVTNLGAYLWHFWTFFPIMPLDTREAWDDVKWLVICIWAALLVFYTLLGRKFSDKLQYHFFWGWQVLTVFPALPILMSQRVLYIPSMGFCLLVGLLLKEHWVACFERRQRGWWLFPVAVAFCFMTTFAMNTMWSQPSLMIRDQITQIQKELPAPEKGSHIYLIDIWPPSYGIEEGLKRAYKNRDLDVQILTFSPKILDEKQPGWNDPLEKLFAAYFPEACGPLQTQHRFMSINERPATLRLELAQDSYFHGLVEGLLPVEPQLGTDVKSVKTDQFEAVLTPQADGSVSRVDFYFADDGRKSYFLVFKNGRYRKLSS